MSMMGTSAAGSAAGSGAASGASAAGAAGTTGAASTAGAGGGGFTDAYKMVSSMGQGQQVTAQDQSRANAGGYTPPVQNSAPIQNQGAGFSDYYRQLRGY